MKVIKRIIHLHELVESNKLYNQVLNSKGVELGYDYVDFTNSKYMVINSTRENPYSGESLPLKYVEPCQTIYSKTSSYFRRNKYIDAGGGRINGLSQSSYIVNYYKKFITKFLMNCKTYDVFKLKINTWDETLEYSISYFLTNILYNRRFLPFSGAHNTIEYDIKRILEKSGVEDVPIFYVDGVVILNKNRNDWETLKYVYDKIPTKSDLKLFKLNYKFSKLKEGDILINKFGHKISFLDRYYGSTFHAYQFKVNGGLYKRPTAYDDINDYTKL